MTQDSATDPHGTGSAGKEAVVSVPDFVKGKWRGVVLTIEDKKSNKKKDYEVKLNSEFTIPDSNIVIKTGEFSRHLRWMIRHTPQGLIILKIPDKSHCYGEWKGDIQGMGLFQIPYDASIYAQ